MIVREALNSSLMRKEQGIILKLDMENSFDRVNLSFLYVVLKEFGFSSKIIDIIKTYTIGPRITPLINGMPSESFQSSQGLRQGCPISPYIYIIVVDSLSRHLEKCRRDPILTGFSI